MFIKEKQPQNKSNLTSRILKSKILEKTQIPDKFTFSLYIYFLFETFCLNVLTTTNIGRSAIGHRESPIYKITKFVTGLYELTENSNDNLYYAVTISFAFYIIFILSILLIIMICIAKDIEIPYYLRSLISYLKQTHVFLFSLPLSNYLLKFLFSVTGDGIGTAKYALIAGAAMIIIINLTINFIGTLTELSLVNKSVLVRSNNYFLWITFVNMTLRGIYFGDLLANSTYAEINRYYVWLDFALILIEVGIYFYFVPLLNTFATDITVFFLSLKLSTSLSNVIVSPTVDDNEISFQSIVIFSLLLFSFIHKFFRILVKDDHPSSVLDLSTLLIKNEYWQIRRIHKFFNHIRSSDHKLDMLKHQHSPDKLLYYSNMHTLSKDTNMNEMSEKFSIDLLNLAENKLNNPDIKMSIVKIMMEEDSNFFQSYSLIQKLIAKERDLVRAVGLQILKKQMEEKKFETQNNSNDCKLITKYLEAILHQEHLTQMIDQFSTRQSKLYRLLQLHSPELLEISQLISVLMNYQTQIQEYWNTIPTSIQHLNPELIRIYSNFIKPFDEGYHKNLVLTYKMVKSKLISKDHRHFFDSKIEISPRTSFLLISLEQIDFGKILLFSQNMPVLLKQPQQNMLGKNIKNFLPFSLQSSLEIKIQSKTNFHNSNQDIEEQQLLIMTSEGYLRIFKEYSHILSIEKRGLCQFSILEYDKDSPEYLLVDENGVIETYTKNIFKDLEIEKINRPTLKSFGEKAALRFDSYIKKISSKKNFNIHIPNNPSWIYCCEVTNGEGQGPYVILAQKTKLKNLLPEENDFEISEGEVPFEFSEHEIKIEKLNPEKSSSFQATPTYLEVKDEVVLHKQPSIIQTTQFFSQNSMEEDEEEERSNQGSMLEESLRQSSVNSSQSYLEHKKVELKETLDSLKFFKFNEKFFPIATALIFVIIYLFAIMFSYSTTTSVIDDVNKRVYIFNQVSGRVRFTLEMCRNAHGNLFYQDFYPNGASRQVSNHGQMLARISQLAAFNNNLRTALGNVEDKKLVSRFFEKNVKVFYDDFTNIAGTDKYIYENSFTATNMLISQADVLYKVSFIKNDFQTYVQHYIMTNAFNDLIQENEKLFDFLLDNVTEMLEKVTNQELNFLIVTIILLACCIISTQIVLYISYKKTSNYLSAFIDPGNIYLTNFMYDAPQILRKEQVKKIDDKKNKKNELKIYKSPQTKKLLAAFMLKMAYVLIFLAIPLVLLIKNHITIGDTETRVRTTMSDLYNFNSIRVHAVYAITLQVTAIVYREGYSLYIKNKNNFAAQIKRMSHLISIQENFSDEALSYLHQDICPYYLYHPIRPNCSLLGKGVAFGGITQTMLSIQTYFTGLDYGIANSNGNISLMSYLFLDPQYIDNYYLISNAINPAVEVFQNLMTNHLISDLTNTSNVILTLFVVGAVIGVGIMFVVVYTVWVKVGGERKVVVQLVRLVPQEFLVRNREVRMYLIKQSDEATRYLKSIEKKMMQND